MVVGVVVGEDCREPAAVWGKGALPGSLLVLTSVRRVEEALDDSAGRDLPEAPTEDDFRIALRG